MQNIKLKRNINSNRRENTAIKKQLYMWQIIKSCDLTATGDGAELFSAKKKNLKVDFSSPELPGQEQQV